MHSKISGQNKATHRYTLKVSKRARHVRFKMSVREGLIVVVPQGFNQKRIPTILEEHKSWIEKARQRVEEQRRLIERDSEAVLPETISLRAVDEEWFVEYRWTSSLRVTCVERRDQTVVISGAVDDQALCLAALRRWVNRKANELLIPWLYAVSKERKISINKVLVKNQRTRWGSCTDRRTISINQKLLFLPEHLVQYVFIHELCHVVHPNHSPDYWAVVGKHEPRYRELDKELRAAWQYVPAWI